MPRLARLDTPDVVNHIIIRGIERRKIFKDNKDKYGKTWGRPRHGCQAYTVDRYVSMMYPRFRIQNEKVNDVKNLPF